MLNIIRKTLSLITLQRIRPHTENYLSHSQSGFRQDRSTADVVWTHKWLAAKSIAENFEIKITGIDMTAAFDTIDRHALLDILKTIIEEDELRVIRFLLSNTVVDTKVNGATEQKPFISNIGTPQGDSLSPVLFVVYLENALREVRSNIPRPTTGKGTSLPGEVAYADDVDFISIDPIDIEKVQKDLAKHKLMVNAEKTEFTTLSRNDDWKGSKKVGSLIGDKEDVDRRKQLSTSALAKLKNIWIAGDKIKRKTKIKLYKALVRSILTYNCGTWALTQSEEEKLDAFHRKQLRKVLNIKYPVKITNKSLYKICDEKPISLYALENRWRLFGHILRRHTEIPANKAMDAYFTLDGKRSRGRPVTTMPITLNKDLSRLPTGTLQLKQKADLDGLRSKAHDRQAWRGLTTEIQEAAEASRSEH